MIYKSKNVDKTYILASKLASLLKGGDIVLLNGDLGAGKTTLVKGIAKAEDIKENVTSPTFTLLKTYDGKDYTIVHVDAYRLEDAYFDELEDYVNDENVIFIEWSDCLKNKELMENNLSINIRYVSKNQRVYEIVGVGKRYEELVKELEANV